MVTVTSATQNAPTVFPLIPCGSGSSNMVTLGCLATGFNPSTITFSWQQGSTSLDNFIQYPPMQKGSEYVGISQLQVSRQDWEAKKSFKCVADHAAGQKHASMVKQNEVYEPPTLKVCSSTDERTEEAYFSCFAKDFSPNKYEIRWLKDDQEITGRIDEVNTSSQGRNDTNGTVLYSVASLLTLKSSEWNEESKVTCLFTGRGERNTVVQRNSTVSKKECTSSKVGCPFTDADVSIIPPRDEEMFVNGKGTIICQVAINKGGPYTVVWEDESGTELLSEPVTQGSKIHQAKIEMTYEEWTKGVKRTCIVQSNDWFDTVKREYQSNTGGVSKRPSVFMLTPVEQSRENTVILTCYVKDFSPKNIYVAWFVDDEDVGTKHPFSTTEPVENNGSFSVYSQLILTRDDWEQTDVVYSCAVYHESLAKSSRSIVRSIGYRTSDKTNVVNLSMNVPETCKA
ncbi:hypothetical protein ATANTOWER_014267 [Ataeniobius toweri]|uniref:Ig-like domain-containing protein n=1 Tax=Ataeniobius toweri TaxID=208326 RepID=A0ABU7BTB4_9TELE|nr:hypothetical protein [Ataeniobius toweri]